MDVKEAPSRHLHTVLSTTRLTANGLDSLAAHYVAWHSRWEIFLGTAMDEKEFFELIQKYAIDIQRVLLQTPRIFGDPKRVEIKTRHRTLNDVLINTFSGRVEIGEDCMFGHGVMLLTGTHDAHKHGEERRLAVPNEGHDIVLERGVWLASGVIVIGPARIGEHAVVAAGSIVRSDIPARTIYSGNPAIKISDV